MAYGKAGASGVPLNVSQHQFLVGASGGRKNREIIMAKREKTAYVQVGSEQNGLLGIWYSS